MLALELAGRIDGEVLVADLDGAAGQRDVAGAEHLIRASRRSRRTTARRSCEYSRKTRSWSRPERVTFDTIGSVFSVRAIRSV